MNNDRNPVPRLEIGVLYADRYRIVAPIGRGGMGQVYLAEDTRLSGKRRALKLTSTPQEEREWFVREARLLAELQHPHLPDIVDYYPPDGSGTAGIVMEYIAGDTLEDLFQRCGRRMPFARVSRYLTQLCEVLCYLHGRQPPIVFRDMKPANVLIDGHDRAVLIDFGIARRYRPGAGSDTERLGTPAFAAPEQIRGEQTETRTDLYGWGAFAYYLLSGGHFAVRRTGSVRKALQSDVPRAFAELLDHVLADDLRERPDSAVQLQQRLIQIAADCGRLSGEASSERVPKAITTQCGVRVAAILSAYPSAGATFATLGLSKALSGSGVPHALVEFPGNEPELYGLLDGARRMPKHAMFADPYGQAESVPAWRHEAAMYYPLDPSGISAAYPETAFGAWVRKIGTPIVLLDVSSAWDRPGAAEWLAEHAHSIWWIADSLPAKWSVRRQEACAALEEIARKRGVRTFWIANRDFKFAQRSQWLSGFPHSPAVLIPQYPAESVILAAWSGEGVPADKGRTFQQWARAVIESQGSYHLFHQPNKHVTMNS